MFTELIEDGKSLVIISIGIIVGGIAFGALFNISDQMVQNSGYAPLQNTYDHTKPIVETSSNINDGFDLGNAIMKLLVLGGFGSALYFVIKFIKNL